MGFADVLTKVVSGAQSATKALTKPDDKKKPPEADDKDDQPRPDDGYGHEYASSPYSLASRMREPAQDPSQQQE